MHAAFLALDHLVLKFLFLMIMVFGVCVVAVAMVVPRRGQRSVLRLLPRPVMTDTEWRFFGILGAALPEFHIFPQVSMSAVMKAEQRWQRGYFSQKVIDFLICDGRTGRVVAIVGLDDWSHDRRRSRDASRDAMTATAGYKTLRWDCRSSPFPDEVRAAVLALDGSLSDTPAIS